MNAPGDILHVLSLFNLLVCNKSFYVYCSRWVHLLMLRVWNRSRLVGLSDILLGSLISHLSNGRTYSTTSTSSVLEAVRSVADESELHDLIKILPPAGSALFRENPHFSPVVFPDPLLDWDRMSQSLVARNHVPEVALEDMVRYSFMFPLIRLFFVIVRDFLRDAVRPLH